MALIVYALPSLLSLAAITFALTGPLAPRATAQSSRETEAPEYKEAVANGVAEFDRGNYPEAREHFRRAHAIAPTARTFRGLGLVEFELRNYGEAASLLEQALVSPVKPLGARHRADVEKLLERTRGYLGTVHVATEPPATTVIVDGTVVELGPSGTLVLEVGNHVFEFSAEGRLPAKHAVSIQGGQTETLRVTLRPLNDPAAIAASIQTAPPSSTLPADRSQKVDAPLYKKWWVWTAAGIVIATAATTTAVMLARDAQTRTEPFTTAHTPPGSTIQTSLMEPR